MSTWQPIHALMFTHIFTQIQIHSHTESHINRLTLFQTHNETLISYRHIHTNTPCHSHALIHASHTPRYPHAFTKLTLTCSFRLTTFSHSGKCSVSHTLACTYTFSHDIFSMPTHLVFSQSHIFTLTQTHSVP